MSYLRTQFQSDSLSLPSGWIIREGQGFSGLAFIDPHFFQVALPFQSLLRPYAAHSLLNRPRL